MPAAIPEHLARLHAAVNGQAGRDWIAALPALIRHFSQLWSLQIGEPFLGGNVAWVAPAERHGRPVVLKINFVDEETRHEPTALRFWNGQSAVRLLQADESAGALLLERLDPGTSLAAHPDRPEAIRIACGLLRRLWRAAPAGHPFDQAADMARAMGFTELAGSEEQFVVNRDFHLGNILLDRGQWKLIDPKPLAGERAFDTGHFLRSLLPAHPDKQAVRTLVDLLSGELLLPARRIRLWALLRSLENAQWAAATGLGEPERDREIAAALDY